MFRTWKRRARDLKTDVHALALAYRDPRVPWLARALTVLVVAYALSPIDLIPDPIPVLGYLDDLLLIPAGIMLVRRLIPPPVLAECQAKARENPLPKPPARWLAGAVIAVAWITIIGVGIAALIKSIN